MNIDDELKIALRRVDAPEGFAERVLARLSQPAAPQPAAPETRPNVVPFRPRRTTVLLSGIAAAALLGAFGSLAFVLPRRAEPARTVAVAPPVETNHATPAAPPVQDPVPAPPLPRQSRAIRPSAMPVKYSVPPRAPRRDVVDEEGARAAEQLMLALRITSDKLSTVKKSVRENLRESLVERRSL